MSLARPLTCICRQLLHRTVASVGVEYMCASCTLSMGTQSGDPKSNAQSPLTPSPATLACTLCTARLSCWPHHCVSLSITTMCHTVACPSTYTCYMLEHLLEASRGNVTRTLPFAHHSDETADSAGGDQPFDIQGRRQGYTQCSRRRTLASGWRQCRKHAPQYRHPVTASDTESLAAARAVPVTSTSPGSRPGVTVIVHLDEGDTTPAPGPAWLQRASCVSAGNGVDSTIRHNTCAQRPITTRQAVNFPPEPT